MSLSESFRKLESIERLRQVCDPSVLTPKKPKTPARIITPRSTKPLPENVAPPALRWTEEQIRPKVKETIGQKVVRIEYTDVPAELNDKTFEDHFGMLFTSVSDFVTYHFGYHDLEADNKEHNLWPIMPKEFADYTSIVAEADPHNGGWNALLMDSVQRKWLVAGILMRIFQRYIFDELLFGATDHEQKLLKSLDEAFLDADGFVRQPLRAQTIRTILRRDPGTQDFSPVTDNFYTDVAMLTDQIYKLLYPLARYLYAKDVPRELRQQLHNIVSNAAYISIVIRCHKDIILLTEVHPGEYYEEDDHTSIEYDTYHNFKARVVDFYTKKAQDERAAGTAMPATQPNNRHRAMCKIAIWPRIRSFKRGSGRSNGENDGLRQCTLTKGTAIWYFGLTDRTRPRQSIQSFVNSLQTPQDGPAPLWGRLHRRLPLPGFITGSRGRKRTGIHKRAGTAKSRSWRSWASTARTANQLRAPASNIKTEPSLAWYMYAIPLCACAVAAYAVLPSLISPDYTATHLHTEVVRDDQPFAKMDRAVHQMTDIARQKGYL